ncbi:YveK family protein [Carnobacterium gallinarum]|uniref:YveK family protein n=1 Tax=Carnobacterium gallinarum TaxID=2749 RepID=UPI00054E5F5F|nr:Wzz/FepE/Etk N-terminal domain-containing protein [Carnobacterium gallinarum]
MEFNIIRETQIILKRYWWIILLVTVLGGVGSILFSQKAPKPTYQATIRFVVTKPTEVDQNGNELTDADPSRFWNSLPILIESPDFVSDVIKKSGYNGTAKELKSNLTVSNDNMSTIVAATLEGTNRDLTIKAANSIFDVFNIRAKELFKVEETRAIQLATIDNVNEVIHSRSKATMFVGIFLGFIIGVLLAIFMNYMTRNRKSAN